MSHEGHSLCDVTFFGHSMTEKPIQVRISFATAAFGGLSRRNVCSDPRAKTRPLPSNCQRRIWPVGSPSVRRKARELEAIDPGSISGVCVCRRAW